MKVLIFMTQFHHMCGAERLDIELAEELNKRGIHTDILSMYTEDLQGVPEAKAVFFNKGIPAVHFLGMRIHPPITSLVPAILKLRRLIREQGYDIVETTMVSSTVLASWATWGTRARHVSGVHQVFTRDRENSIQHKFFRFSIRCNHHIRYYAVSDCATNQWVDYSHTSPQHMRRIYNAVSDDFFSATPDRDEVRRELGIPEDSRLAIYVGRLAAFKGIDTLLDALGPVLERQKIFLLYVGQPDLTVNGTKELIKNIEKRLLKESWCDRVRFLGYRKDVPRLMASADVLVHPTRIEGFGLILVEAMAAGLPVVASNVEAIPEVLTGTESIMVPPDDPKALREAVLKILSLSPEEVSRLVAIGRKHAEKYRVDGRIDAMIRLFEDLIVGKF